MLRSLVERDYLQPFQLLILAFSEKHWLYLAKANNKINSKTFMFMFTHRFPTFAPSTSYSRIPSRSLVPPVLRVLRGLVEPKENQAETEEMQVFLLIKKIWIRQILKSSLDMFTGHLVHNIYKNGKYWFFFSLFFIYLT